MEDTPPTYDELLNRFRSLQQTNNALAQENEQLKKVTSERQKFGNTLAAETPDIIYIFDIASNRNIYINKNLRELLNYPYGSVPEDSTELVNLVMHPDDVSKFLEYSELVKSWSHEYVHEYEYRLKDASGKWRWFLGKEREFERQNDKIITIIGITSDITQWKKTEQELIKAKEKAEVSKQNYKNLYSLFRNMADIMPDMIWAKDLNNKYIFINNSMCKNLLNAIDTKEPIGKNDMYFAMRERTSHPDDPNWHTFGEICRDSDSIVLEEGTTQQFNEFGNIKGKFLYLDVVKTPLKNQLGETIGVVGAARDVTDRKQAEGELTKQSELRQILVDISSQYINIPLQNIERAIDHSLEKLGEFVNADRAYIFSINKEITHYSNMHEWCREGIIPQINKEQNIAINKDLKEYLIEGKSINVPDVNLIPHIETRELLLKQDIKSIILVPMMSFGKCIGFIGFDSVLKMHHYSETEQQLLEVFAEIQVNIKNRQTSEQETIKAKELAEESNNLKTSFLQNISHEIRTPMNAICGFSELLKETTISDDKRILFASIIQNSGNQLLSIVNNILTISALETNQEKANLKPTNLNRLLTDILNIFNNQANHQKIKLHTKFALPDEDSELLTDGTKINQIITNLITNALKFTHNGSIEFGYTIDNKTTNPKITLFVKDTGIGISPEYHTKIFERFRQAHKRIAADYGGTGLGLSISQGFAKLLDGKMWVESELGKGSTFYCMLPYTTIKTVHLPPNLDTPIMNNLTILVAEDEEYNFLYLEELLNRHNFKILHAKNGQEAIDFCKTESVDMVLMDIKMPLMDGYTAAISIKKANPNIPIIAQTAYAMEHEIHNYGSAFDGYLTKPITRELLEKEIQTFLLQR